MRDFRYSSLGRAKLDLIDSKLVSLDSKLNVLLSKLSFIALQKIKQLLFAICLLFIIFLVLVVVPVTLAKQKRRCIKRQWNKLRLTITAVYKHLNDCAQFTNIYFILRLYICHCLRPHHLFNTVRN